MIRRCFLACWILAFSTVDLQSTQYQLLGQSVTFSPIIKTPPDEILWKFNGNKVVEFNGNEETVFSPFEQRIVLDWHTAVLEIKQLSHADSGQYELDVLTKEGLNRFYFNLEVIDRVAKPNIFCKMNNGSSSSSDKSGKEATLMCSADSSSQPLTFEWSQHGKTHPGQNLKILLGKEHDDEVYSCTVSNRLSIETATFTAKDCYPGNSSTGLSAGLSAVISVIVLLCVFGILGFVYCKLKHKACFAKEKTNDVERQKSLDDTSEPLIDSNPAFHPSQRRVPLPGMSRNKNYNQNDEGDTESNEDAGTGLENREDKVKTQPPVPKKPSFNGNLARNVKGEFDADPHREELETKVLPIDLLENHSGATQHDLQPHTASGPPVSVKSRARNFEQNKEPTGLENREDKVKTQPPVPKKPSFKGNVKGENDADLHREEPKKKVLPVDLLENRSGATQHDLQPHTASGPPEINKDVHKKPGPPVAEKPRFLARNKGVTGMDPHQDPMEKKGLQCARLEEHRGATKPDLQTAAASEQPESEKEENEEAANTAPADEKNDKKTDTIKDQVTGETKEENENESDDLREKSESPTTDEHTESEKEEGEEAPNMVPADEQNGKKEDAVKDQVTGETKEEKEENETDDTRGEETSPATDEQTEPEKEADDKAKSDPEVGGSPSAAKPCSPSTQTPPKMAPKNDTDERGDDSNSEHSGATESDLQSSTASETPELEKDTNDKAKSDPEVGGSPSAAEPCSPSTQTPPKMAPKNDPDERGDDSNSEQVTTGETNE